MIRLVGRILKRHLDDAAKEAEREYEFNHISPYDLIWAWPTYEERRALTKELTEAIRGADLSHMIEVPSREKAEYILQRILPMSDDIAPWISVYARQLVEYLSGEAPDGIPGHAFQRFHDARHPSSKWEKG